MISFRIDVDMYSYGMWVCIGTPAEAVGFINRKLGLPNRDTPSYKEMQFDTLGGKLIAYKDCVPVMWLPKVPDDSHEVASLTHELLHVTFRIMDWVGCELDESSEEAYCYLHSFLVMKFYEKLSAIVGKKKK
jgi:hypothetical protein